MTNEKAIEILKNGLQGITNFTEKQELEAFDLAIKALDIYKPLCPLDYPTEDDPYPVCAYKRPQGKWTEHEDYNNDTYYTCSNCGEDWATIEGTPSDNMMNYCPHCGADMREGRQ